MSGKLWDPSTNALLSERELKLTIESIRSVVRLEFQSIQGFEARIELDSSAK